jgi:hypothetical protein
VNGVLSFNEGEFQNKFAGKTLRHNILT